MVRAKFGIEGIGLPYIQYVVTSEHPFWVEGKGWVTANQLTTEDIVVDKDGNKYIAAAAGYNAKAQANIYKINQSNHGLMPYYGSEDRFDAVLVDLIKGIEIDEVVKDHPTLNKLYSKNIHWKEDLLEQLSEEDRANAHFHGFSQGDWVNPETIQWDESEGYVTTMVYNLEVENTHTYFVGEYSIWVHQCAGAKTNIEN
ncbi:hypothetical protein [Acinetobacter sp.]|uniref:hypothetical protein n=1 Tax=Acinetobacter sp. TaxID=472 RepID=UPI0035B02974